MPIITISRQYGSGGSEVAALLARELGWALLDNSVVDAVAARMGLTVPEVAAREERVTSLGERITNAMAMSAPELLPPMANAKFPPSEEQLLEVTHRVIEDAANQGPVVIVGRGAQEILGSRSDMLSVFCYAPRSALIAHTMERDRVDAATAARRVDETNKQRAEWTRAHWQREWGAPEHYHLCVNTQLLGIPLATSTIAYVARARFSRTDLDES